MTRTEKITLGHVYAKLKYLTEEMRVNGEDGTAPLEGLGPILQAHHKMLMETNRRLNGLEDITSSLKTSHDLKKSLSAYLKERPIIGAVLRNPRLVLLWLAIISAITGALFGFRII